MGLKKALKIAAVWAKLSSEISEHSVSKNGYMNWFCYTFGKRLFELLETLIQVSLAFTTILEYDLSKFFLMLFIPYGKDGYMLIHHYS